MFRKIAVVLLGVVLMSLPACANPSGPLRFERAERGVTVAGAADTVSESAAFTQANARKYWFSGWVVTHVANRRTNSMYDGIVLMPDRVLVNARVFGHSYRYYRHGNDTMIFDDGRWSHTDKGSATLNPMANLELLSDLVRGLPARRLKDEVIVGQPTTVLEFRVPAKNVRKTLSSLGLSEMDLKKARVDQAEIKLTVWVGQKQPYVYQYQSVATLPVSGVGAMEQEVYYRFWDFNNERIQPKEFTRVEQEIGG